ncbi:DUF2332 domain-containing protein [Sporosarcina sp. ZBG7A]|uniref:DUF2332 domain-containing protein n=1 Tax=Sporosarcina sp. ZBG7A TaxID=1582223 RepID=UPI0035104D1B
MMQNSHLSWSFMNFANMECKGSSELYEFLSLKIAEDAEVLNLCLAVPKGQPVPNLLFGAVHYLLLKGYVHPLKDYYSSVTNPPRKIDNETFSNFKDFCERYREEIISIVESKLVQTNEVRRCGYLYPVFSWIYNKVERPLSLIEIGTSAGLQLLWDHYSYSYGTGETFGKEGARVHITSEVKGDHFPIILSESPPIASKIGLDLNISNLSDSEDYLWLKSLIWPEHQERMELFDRAAESLKENPVKLVEGDGVFLLPDVVDTLPTDSTICIFHTHVANQIPNETKHELLDKIAKIGSKRDVFHIYNNMWDRQLHLDYYVNGVESKNTIGDTDGHGRWFEWKL